MTPRARLWRGVAIALAGSLLYAVFLLATLPAAWLGDWLARQSRGQLVLQAAQGSVWDGAGQLRIAGAGGEPLVVRLRWRVQPLWLVTGRLRAQLQAEDGLNLRTGLDLGWRRLQLGNLEAELPAAAIPALFAPAALLAPSGRLRLTSDEFEWQAGSLHGELRIAWTGAGTSLGGAGELGDYLLVINGQGSTAALRLDTLRGEVRLAGQGSWQPGDGRLQLDASLRPGTREAQLAPLLQMMQARHEGEEYRFSFDTRLPP